MTDDRPGATYRIIRFYARDDVRNRIMGRGLTFAAVQAHCNDPETSSSTATSEAARAHTAKFGPWFDAWTDDKRGAK